MNTNLLATATAMVRDLEERQPDAEEVIDALAGLRAQFPEHRLDLVWHREPFSGRRAFAVVVDDERGTLSLGWTPGSELPFVLRGVQRKSEHELVRVDGTALTVGEAIQALEFLWREMRLLDRVIDTALVNQPMSLRNVLRVALLVVVSSGCAHGRAGAREACGEPIENLELGVRPGTITLLAETHGTDVTPRAVGDMVCAATRSGPFTLALELWPADQALFDAYLHSAGRSEDRARLRRARIWRVNDGRASVALFELFERLRRIVAAGARVRVELVDEGGRDYDGKMADALERLHRERPLEPIVLLVGGYHARMVRGGLPWDAEYEPIGWRLLQRKLPVRSFALTYGDGEAWSCINPEDPTDCGPVRSSAIDPPASRARRGFDLVTAIEGGYQGTFFVGTPKASRPWREVESGR